MCVASVSRCIRPGRPGESRRVPTARLALVRACASTPFDSSPATTSNDPSSRFASTAVSRRPGSSPPSGPCARSTFAWPITQLKKVSSAPRRRRRRPPPTTFSASPINASRSCRSSVPCPRTGRRVTCTWRARTRAGTSSGDTCWRTPSSSRRARSCWDRARRCDSSGSWMRPPGSTNSSCARAVAVGRESRGRRGNARDGRDNAPRRRGNERRRAIVRNRRERCSDGSRA